MDAMVPLETGIELLEATPVAAALLADVEGVPEVDRAVEAPAEVDNEEETIVN